MSHALEDPMRIAFHHAAIHERARIAFIAIADHVLMLPAALATVLHFNPVG